MSGVIRPEVEERRRFWFWLVAAVLALLLLFAVLNLTAPQASRATPSLPPAERNVFMVSFDG